MHPPVPEERIDALFLSPHKFIGGPEASGILVANRGLFRTRVPERPGGGTVEYVAGPHHEDVDYTRRFDLREEGGTPAILGDLRAGLAFLVKERIGAQAIGEHEIALARRAAQRLSHHPRIRVLGPTNLPRLAIIPITIEGLHHGFVSVLLDHLFGIQSRAGCSCAGPYGHRLLGIGREASGRIRRLVRRGIQGVKPGWARVSLPFYASEEDLDFVLSAIEFVASHGLDFLPLYRLSWRDGVWHHIERPANFRPLVLDAETLWAETQGHGGDEREKSLTDAELRMERARYFMEAEELRSCLRERWEKSPPAWNPPTGDPEVDELVRFRYVQADDLK
jgi:hypothetical protein